MSKKCLTRAVFNLLKSIVFLFMLVNQSQAYIDGSLATQTRCPLKNLSKIDFIEKTEIKNIIDELANSAKDPYTSSLPLIASSELGDEKRYELARTQMALALTNLNENPNDYPQWMRNNSFKAWMLGRLLLSADSMQDQIIVDQARNKLLILLEGKMTKEDSEAFFTWAQAYRAALNLTEYELSKEKMTSDSIRLSEKYKANPTDHAALSDALWAWVMNLFASANANDQQGYELAKQQMKRLVEKNSVTEALETGLLRTTDSNDYPAWALAKVQFSAAIMRDQILYKEIDRTLATSIQNAKKSGAKAEYILSMLDNQLAMECSKENI